MTAREIMDYRVRKVFFESKADLDEFSAFLTDRGWIWSSGDSLIEISQWGNTLYSGMVYILNHERKTVMWNSSDFSHEVIYTVECPILDFSSDDFQSLIKP